MSKGIDKIVEKMTKELMDRGLIIEAGFRSLRLMALPVNAPDFQVEQLREFFFAGSVHVFYSVLCSSDPGEEPTPADEARMEKVAKELEKFHNEFKAKYKLR